MGSTTDHLLLLPTQHTERSKYDEGRADRVIANRGPTACRWQDWSHIYPVLIGKKKITVAKATYLRPVLPSYVVMSSDGALFKKMISGWDPWISLHVFFHQDEVEYQPKKTKRDEEREKDKVWDALKLCYKVFLHQLAPREKANELIWASWQFVADNPALDKVVRLGWNRLG